jgi:hypothetical protein
VKFQGAAGMAGSPAGCGRRKGDYQMPGSGKSLSLVKGNHPQPLAADFYTKNFDLFSYPWIVNHYSNAFFPRCNSAGKIPPGWIALQGVPSGWAAAGGADLLVLW